MTANTKTYVNTANTVLGRAGFGVALSYQTPTVSGFANLFSKGVQTTPQTARGYMPGSAIAYMNNNLVHNCDFKFIDGLNIGIGDLVSILGSIGNAIKNAKNAAAALIRKLLGDLIDSISLALNAISQALSFDATGQLSLSFNVAKDIINKIKTIVDKIAQKVEDVLTYVYFVEDIVALLKWIEGLPAQIKALLVDCLTQFKNSLSAIKTQISSIPNLGTSAVDAVTNSISSQYQSTLSSLSSSTQSSNLPPSMASLLTSPSSANAATIVTTYVASATSSLAPTTTSMKANTAGP